MSLLVTAVPLGIAFSAVTGFGIVPPELRYAWYVVAGATAGTWLLLRERVRSSVLRLTAAPAAGVLALALLATLPSLPDGLGLMLGAACLPAGVFGWFSFGRHVEDRAERAGGWRPFLAGRGG